MIEYASSAFEWTPAGKAGFKVCANRFAKRRFLGMIVNFLKVERILHNLDRKVIMSCHSIKLRLGRFVGFA